MKIKKLIFFFSLLTITTCCIYNFSSVLDGTVYAPDYLEREFVSITIGMQEKNVILRLGQPLRINLLDEFIVWEYLGPAQDSAERSGPAVTPAMTKVTADLSGRVVEITGTYKKAPPGHLVGQSIEKARDLFGKPSRVVESRARKQLVYATGTGFRSHYNRSIGIDAEGKVCYIKANKYKD